MDAQPLAAFMITLFVVAYLAAETYVRRGRARDAARAAAHTAGRAVATRPARGVVRAGDPVDLRLMSFPWGSGPCR